MVGGKGVAEGDPYGETSVTPAWRKALTHFGTTGPQIDWAAFNSTQWKENAMQATDMLTALRAITLDSGAYYNEAAYYEPNWEQSFWGMENYRKLKSIKQKYDPTGMFRVWNGVGGTRPETKDEHACDTTAFPY